MEDMILFSGSASAELAQELASLTGAQYGDAIVAHHADGEPKERLCTPVERRCVVLLVSITSADTLVEALWLIDAAVRHGAASVTLLAPFLAYGRQDRPTPGQQEPHAAALTLQLIEQCGAHRLLTIDIHNPVVLSCVRMPVTNLLPTSAMIAAWSNAGLDLDALRIAAPDPGAIRRAAAFSDALGKGDPAMLAKRRSAGGACVTWGMVGDVRDRPVMLVDDLVSTGATLVQAADVLLEKGASAVYATVSHVRGPLAAWLPASPIARLFTTGSIPLPERPAEKHVVVPVARLLAQALTGGRVAR